MKKEARLFVLIFILVIGFHFIIAAETNFTSSDQSDEGKINLAYTCLEDKISSKGCSQLTLEEKIFSVLSTGKCAKEFLESSKDEACWPKSNCDVENTAKAMVAVKRLNRDTEDIKNWILTKNRTSDDLDWYLQIEGNKEMECKLKYSGKEYTIDISEDKKISQGAGTCLSTTFDKYWLSISSSCYRTEFEISCNEAFQTNLIYKRTNSPVLFVSGKTNTGSSSGVTTEKVDSECFVKDGECDYLTTLWATYALLYASKDSYDISPFWSYLQAMNGEDEEILSDGMLGYFSDSPVFKSNLIQKQKSGGYWSVTGDNFYDTSFALFPYSGESFEAKEKAMSWLLSPGVQDKEGCWKGNILNTAFILYSVWPKAISSQSSTSVSPSCESANYFCLSPVECTNNGGNLLSSYSCNFAGKTCCDKNATLRSCSEMEGRVCNSNQECDGGIIEDALNLGAGEKCCIGGTCKTAEVESECEQGGGTCVPVSIDCASNEEEADYSCSKTSEICCVRNSSPQKEKSSGLWIWIFILILLIVIVTLLIVFRDKLRPYWLKMTSRFGKGKSSGQPISRGPPGMPPQSATRFPQRGMPIRRIPVQQTPGMNANRVPGNFPQRNSNPNIPQRNFNQAPSQRNPNFQNNQTNQAIDKLKEMNK